MYYTDMEKVVILPRSNHGDNQISEKLCLKKWQKGDFIYTIQI
jgi:hypothetical protein